MKKEDIEFLKDLQHQLNTQSTVGQADPRFWVVKQKVKVSGIESGYGEDGSEVIYDCDTIGETMEEVVEYIKECDDEVKVEIEKAIVYFNRGTDREVHCVDMYDLVQYMIDYLEFDAYSLYVCNYREVDEIVENTFFLTLEECEKHIEKNRYHYREPYPYAMTGWRSPQVERLWKILQESNFDLLEEE